jgi:putative aminopeptidase FrvX
MMGEEEITHIVIEYKQSTTMTMTATHMDEIGLIICAYCNKNPCL